MTLINRSAGAVVWMVVWTLVWMPGNSSGLTIYRLGGEGLPAPDESAFLEVDF